MVPPHIVSCWNTVYHGSGLGLIPGRVCHAFYSLRSPPSLPFKNPGIWFPWHQHPPALRRSFRQPPPNLSHLTNSRERSGLIPVFSAVEKFFAGDGFMHPEDAIRADAGRKHS